MITEIQKKLAAGLPLVPSEAAHVAQLLKFAPTISSAVKMVEGSGTTAILKGETDNGTTLFVVMVSDDPTPLFLRKLDQLTDGEL